MLRAARFGIGISAPMAQEYERRYGLPFVAFANCVADDEFADPAARTGATGTELDRPVELVYVGALHLDRWKTLLGVADAVDAVNRAGLSVRLTVHAPEKDRAWYGPAFAGRPAVRLGPSLADEEVPAVLRAADVLLHVEPFTTAHRRYVRYSLSTKLPQYLAAGRPVLGYGPEELASMAHLDATGAALLVGRNEPALLVERLTALCAAAGLRDRLARAGYASALRHHRRTRVAAEFADVLRSAVSRPAEPVRGSV
ncbi:hypothetical protein JNW88_04870 [Micromonospora sp. ATA32]|nr:hypothetical protein [Micromonospora sp. ATA32]